MMKKQMLVFALAGAFIAFTACRRTAEDPSSPTAGWENRGTDKTLKALNRECRTLYEADRTDSAFTIYSRIFRNFPASPAGNRDSLRAETGIALQYFYNSSYYENKEEVFKQITDSLAHTRHPYLTGPCLHYLTAYRCLATRFTGDGDSEALLREAASLPPAGDATQEMIFAHLVARTLQRYSRPAEQYIPMQQRAVRAFRAGGQFEDPTDILSQMGYFYNRTGQYEKGAECLQEGVDYLRSHPGYKKIGAIYLYGDLSNLYARLGMSDKALEANASAIQASRERNGLLLTDLFRMRGNLFDELGQTDSALVCFEEALRAAAAIADKARAESLADGIRSDRAIFMVDHSERFPGALPEAIALLQKSCADTLRDTTTEQFMLGLAFAKNGDPGKGIPMMEEAAREFAAQQFDENLDHAYGELMKMYASQGLNDKLATLFPHFIALRDSVRKEDKIRATIAANIRYETGRKEQENRVLTAEVALKERSLVYMHIILILAGCLLAGAVAYLFQRRRMHREEQEMHRRQLNGLLSAQQELNRRNEQLSFELEQAVHNETIDHVRQKLDPTLLSGEDEKRFRQSFAALYPRYLPGLRARCAELTKSDELLCMLIHLNQNTDEIALALGISRASVNSGRSRIRKKFGLRKEESLEAYLENVD